MPAQSSPIKFDRVPAHQPVDVRRNVPPEELFDKVGAELDGPGPHDLLVYLHVPFCSSKCHFCDFVADLDVPDLLSGPSVRGRYVDAMCRQIRGYGPRLTELGYRPRLVYWGGGTPSRLSGPELGQIMATLTESFDLAGVQENSLEASPETLTEEKVVQLRTSGVNRISIGVQSFVDEELRRSARAHSADEAIAAAQAVGRGGIDNLNIDLISAMPEQTLDQLRYSLDTCVELAPAHVTVYAYRADPRTIMARQIGRGNRTSAALEHMIESFELCQTFLAQAGYHEYALGYFSRDPGRRFEGEAYYFELTGDYIGFGSGAGSCLGHHSVSNSYQTFHRYREDPLTVEASERYSLENLGIIGRDLRLALTTPNGIVAESFERHFGCSFAELRALRRFRDYVEFFRFCGAEIIEDDTGLRLTPESMVRTHLASYVNSLEYVTS